MVRVEARKCFCSTLCLQLVYARMFVHTAAVLTLGCIDVAMNSRDKTFVAIVELCALVEPLPPTQHLTRLLFAFCPDFSYHYGALFR